MARPIILTPNPTSAANAQPKGPIGLVLDDNVADFLIEVFRGSPLVADITDLADTDDPYDEADDICEACELLALAEDEGQPDDIDPDELTHTCARLACYHPRSCSDCGRSGRACGRSSVGDRGHENCKARTTKPRVIDVLDAGRGW